MMERSGNEKEAVGNLLKMIRVKLETMPVQNSKVTKSFDVLDHLETLIAKQQDKGAMEKLITFLSSITLAPIRNEIYQLKMHLQLINH